LIEFNTCPYEKTPIPEDCGIGVFNPPYGERIGATSDKTKYSSSKQEEATRRRRIIIRKSFDRQDKDSQIRSRGTRILETHYFI
jgi:23S rRNA G2445 N2-methylase RlmL